jgi:hypothetical protein
MAKAIRVWHVKFYMEICHEHIFKFWTNCFLYADNYVYDDDAKFFWVKVANLTSFEPELVDNCS